jgi:hypothetical protein
VKDQRVPEAPEPGTHLVERVSIAPSLGVANACLRDSRADLGARGLAAANGRSLDVLDGRMQVATGFLWHAAISTYLRGVGAS